MADLRFAYGKKENVNSAISNGKIPPGTLICTENTNEILFYNLNRELQSYVNKYIFNSKEEAVSWISQNDCKGKPISIYEDNVYNLYIVEEDNTLTLVNKVSDDVNLIGKSSEGVNKVTVTDDGELLVNTIDTDHITNSIDNELILVGGTSQESLIVQAQHYVESMKVIHGDIINNNRIIDKETNIDLSMYLHEDSSITEIGICPGGTINKDNFSLGTLDLNVPVNGVIAGNTITYGPETYIANQSDPSGTSGIGHWCCISITGHCDISKAKYRCLNGEWIDFIPCEDPNTMKLSIDIQQSQLDNPNAGDYVKYVWQFDWNSDGIVDQTLNLLIHKNTTLGT